MASAIVCTCLRIACHVCASLRKSPDFTQVTIDLEVYDLKHLTSIIAQLRAKNAVAHVERVNA